MAVKAIDIETIAERVSAQSISCTSMVITLFGDTVVAHGGWIWLGSVIRVMESLGFSERLVRTAVFRLVQQEWLQVNKVGRRSYYCLTDSAKAEHEKANRRIYASDHPQWDGTWTLVLPLAVAEELKEPLRKSLLWQGYNTLLPGLMAHPSSDRLSLNETLQELNIVSDVLVFSATTDEATSQLLVKRLVQERWRLEELSLLYRNFLDFYRPLLSTTESANNSTEIAFLLRTVMVHDYRRILLRDPDFPEKMLPSGWAGLETQQLLQRLYRQWLAPSLAFVEQQLSNAQGPLSKPSDRFYQRLGGLPK